MPVVINAPCDVRPAPLMNFCKLFDETGSRELGKASVLLAVLTING